LRDDVGIVRASSPTQQFEKHIIIRAVQAINSQRRRAEVCDGEPLIV